MPPTTTAYSGSLIVASISRTARTSCRRFSAVVERGQRQIGEPDAHRVEQFRQRAVAGRAGHAPRSRYSSASIAHGTILRDRLGDRRAVRLGASQRGFDTRSRGRPAATAALRPLLEAAPDSAASSAFASAIHAGTPARVASSTFLQFASRPISASRVRGRSHRLRRRRDPLRDDLALRLGADRFEQPLAQWHEARLRPQTAGAVGKRPASFPERNSRCSPRWRCAALSASSRSSVCAAVPGDVRRVGHSDVGAVQASIPSPVDRERTGRSLTVSGSKKSPGMPEP